MTELPVAMGVVRRLRTAFGDEVGSRVGYADDLRPPPAMGQWYLTVGQNTSVSTCKAGGTIATHTVTVCATCKYAHVPGDRRGETELNSYLFPDAMPGFGSNGLPPLFERPEVQPPIAWLIGVVKELLLGDYEVRKDISHFLGDDKLGESHGESTADPDPRYAVPVPFTQAATNATARQGGDWVQAAGGRDAGVFVKMVVLSGLQTVTPQRYLTGNDRTWETR